MGTERIALYGAIRSKPANPDDCIISDNCVFENPILPDESFTKDLQVFENCVSVNNDFCEKLVSLWKLPIKFDERFEVASVPFFITDFNLLSYELDNFTFNVLYWVILCSYYIKTKWNQYTLTVPLEKSKTVSFASSIMKNINVNFYILPAKLICCIPFGLVPGFCCLLKSAAVSL